MSRQYLLAIDQGTTSSRAIIFSADGELITSASQEFQQIYPHEGWVEHDPTTLWQTTLATCQQAIRESGLSASQISAIGITNQRETTIVWDKITGEPIYNAIVWQDRRTAMRCQALQNQTELVEKIKLKTGLMVDPYFSASKIEWLLDNVEGAREKAEQGQLCFGTVDSFLLWHLTAGKSFATDATNASRTMLFNIVENDWDDELLTLFNIPKSILPVVKDSADDYGVTAAELFEYPIAISAIIGDQQSALVGQMCIKKGMMKSTYGTGCFVMVNAGSDIQYSQHKLLTTIAYRLSGEVTYALEGSIFMAGATMQWLRDGLELIGNVADSQTIAESMVGENHVYLIPAFTGLGAPHWQADARGAIVGLTRDSGIKEIVTAALASVGYQTRDLLEALAQDNVTTTQLRVDGGMAVNDWLMQFLADMLDLTIERPFITETTALGAAILAGLQQNLYADLEQATRAWQLQKSFSPEMPSHLRERCYQGWLVALNRVID